MKLTATFNSSNFSYHQKEGEQHGFGLGTGTVAEGWIEDAVRFWETNTKN